MRLWFRSWVGNALIWTTTQTAVHIWWLVSDFMTHMHSVACVRVCVCVCLCVCVFVCVLQGGSVVQRSFWEHVLAGSGSCTSHTWRLAEWSVGLWR